jgi:predicted MFS family arabinose efflux permease
VDVVGAVLGAVGLGGVVYALIEQPKYGWSDPRIFIPLVGGVVALVAFLFYERRTDEPMVKLELFARRNFAVGNAETLVMYAAVGVLFFFLVIFLQETAGYSAVESGLVTVPVTLIMFFLSRRLGGLADRYGPRAFMGGGPLVATAGILMLLRTGTTTSFFTDLLPGLAIFGVGLSITVAPLTATVLADADETDAGIASAINNTVSRVAGLVGISVVGLVVAGTLVGDTFAANDESVRAFHQVLVICAALMAAGGVAGLVGIVNPKREVAATGCAGGQLVGAPQAAAAAGGRRR